jgi:hypothetical protein
MTDLEKRAVVALRSVRFPKETWHARRAKSLSGLMEKYPRVRLYSASAGDLWFLVWTYRRQVADLEVVAKADEFVNGALGLSF